MLFVLAIFFIAVGYFTLVEESYGFDRTMALINGHDDMEVYDKVRPPPICVIHVCRRFFLMCCQYVFICRRVFFQEPGFYTDYCAARPVYNFFSSRSR